jgi:hypothetical protein
VSGMSKCPKCESFDLPTDRYFIEHDIFTFSQLRRHVNDSNCCDVTKSRLYDSIAALPGEIAQEPSCFVRKEKRGMLAQRNAGITSLAKSRMDFLISSCWMPPKLKVVVKILK